MKKISIAFLIVVLLIFQVIAVSALTSSEAKQEWQNAKQASGEKQETHRDAKIKFAGDKSEENKQAVVDTGKEALMAALDEVEAWLVWKNIEAQENPDVPEELKEAVSSDVDANIAKISELRVDVNGIDNQLELGLVFLKMVGKYAELLADVARDSGKILSSLGEKYLGKAEEYEGKLRAEAENMENNAEILAKLDTAKSSIAEARSNVEKAKASYEQVRLPGTPLIKFAEGNNYLRVAKTNLISAHSSLNQAYLLMMGRE